jgi:Zn-dependent M28 family amino/carboxypeptidase
VVVGAHLDTVLDSPGADDNASGVAALLEVGRLLGALTEPPDVTLMVFDAEEVGLIGSRQAVRRLARSHQVRGMICLESVGFFSSSPGGQLLPPGAAFAFPAAVAEVRATDHRGDFTLVIHRESSRRAAETFSGAAAAAPVALRSVLLCDPRPDGPLGAIVGLAVPALNHLGRSDHAPFWNHGIPALMLTSTCNVRNDHYHRPSDLPETLDYERLASLATATAVTALTWSQAPMGRPGRA